MDNERVSFTVKDHIGFVRLNRPEKHNALDMAMFKSINRVIRQIRKNRDIRVVIVSGVGESFCSGLDTKSVLKSPINGIKLLWKWLPGNANLAQKVVVGWRRLAVPVIMEIHGKCWGGGMQIALGGDFRIAHKDASLSIMETRWGLIPDMGGTLALRESLAADRAMQLAMTSKIIGAEEALSLGLVTKISDAPESDSLSLANELLQRSPDTNKEIKRLYHQVWCRKERRILASETWRQWKILMGKNQKIAVKRALGNTSIEFK
ncbi:crotonase/enoyl-CoA hydratase family protein [Pleionea sediminis]|uniref:crotonase/enoyl-CoA hydratase family protein n=1 Tax=Pleionea sediminis TaxID=2569479 RepID=UPI00118568C1|nr:crotonase/enoyl-CoA hydratase family protein [Pleionea sediminis]